MKTITDITEFWHEVWQITKRYNKKDAILRISTFGLFAFQGESHLRHYFDLLSNMKFKQINLVVGMSKFSPCKKDCLDCYNKYCRQVITMRKFIECYPFLNVDIVYDTHMKLFMATEGDNCDYIVGGINFGDSQWNDSAVVLSGKNDALVGLFDYIQNLAKKFDFVPHLVPPDEPVEKGVIKFGKYKGRTWKEIEKENPQYIDWCRSQQGITVEL